MTRLVVHAPRAWLGRDDPVDDVVVVCEGDAIAAVDVGTATLPDADVLELGGFLMPAAADRHVHIGLSEPGAVLRGGVTAVRDLAWPSDAIFPLADLSESPTFDGPLVRAAGPMLTGPGGYPCRASWAPEGTGREVHGPDDAAAAVRDLHALGATAIKVSLHAEAGPTPSDAELATIVEAARALELPVTAHAQGAGQVDRAIGAGIDELAHAPWTERLSDDAIRRCAARVRIVSTLAIHAGSAQALEIALENLRRFRDAGGRVVYGSDLGNAGVPAGIHGEELRLLHEAGLTAAEVLGATIRAPLEPGAPADLIVVAGDPFVDVTAAARVIRVVRGGRIV